MADFKSAIGRGAIVTVMNAKVYRPTKLMIDSWKTKAPSAILTDFKEEDVIAEIDHLKFANLVMSGPDITITGGRYANTLVKFGKSLRCEMQSALCDQKALVELGGASYDEADGSLTITDKFPGPVSIVGDTFIVDQASGEQIPVKIIVYQFLPDAIVSLTQDEATAATFDLNGDVMTVAIDGDDGSCPTSISAFYSIVDACKPEEPEESGEEDSGEEGSGGGE